MGQCSRKPSKFLIFMVRHQKILFKEKSQEIGAYVIWSYGILTHDLQEQMVKSSPSEEWVRWNGEKRGGCFLFTPEPFSIF